MQLESIMRFPSLPAALAHCAQMVLRLADGETNSALSRLFGTSHPMASVWR
jgi:hypothetical protein